jgi:hypothetical protein
MRWKPPTKCANENSTHSPTGGTVNLKHSPTGGTDSPMGGTMVPKLPHTVPWVGLYGGKRPLS